MDAYTGFAVVYDMFMDNIPYEEWGEYIISILKDYGVKEGLVLDLGCGTGNLTRILAGNGYDMIGIDNSTEMLQVAMEHPKKAGEDILYLCQDMREFELYGTVAAVVSICDCINYIIEKEELLEVFRLVNNYLDPGGIFLFDLNTVHKYRDIIGETTIVENREEGSFIWENYYDEEDKINEYDLTIFKKEQGEKYSKHEEVHYQRAYELEEIKELLIAADLEFLCAYNAFTHDLPTPKSERIYVLARESGKTINKQI